MTGKEILKLLGSKIYVNIGYIIVPPDVERGTFIADCYSKEEVSIYPETGGTSYNRVKITPDSLQNIEFPNEGEDFGSMVIYFFHPIHRYPIVFGVLDKRNECKFLQWKQFKRSKVYKDSEVTVLGDAVRSSLKIKVKGGNGKNGSFLIRVEDPEGKGFLDLTVQGNVRLLCNTLSILNRDLSIVSKNSLSILNNETHVETLRFFLKCIEERQDKFKEDLFEDTKEKLGSFSLEAKSLDIVVGGTTIHIEDTEGDEPSPHISINGGENFGIIKIVELTKKLNELISDINSFKKIYNSHKHTGSTCPDGPVQIMAPSESGSQVNESSEFLKEDYEDTKIFH